ncbi:hypothetical protein Z043_112662 [Scleropages formosus]|uniref:Nerve growth factor-related domain-containing protein n=1 Tax=Scleropages formosus TaxID=113540 RepID=A0A0P7U3B9_SCLFO|nr:beta-nerve growth factor [Scleropages formosus]KPP68642.1 hypothetical protein Z043_112662 [Scleropages formosus]
MRSSTLILLFLIGVQAAVNMTGEDQAQEGARPRKQPHGKITHPTPMDNRTPSSQTEPTPLDSIPTVDPELFRKRRRLSPRVLFSAHPPKSRPSTRARRNTDHPQNRGEYSVCDSSSDWVGNKTTATDLKGNDVEVLPYVNINNVVKKQYFFETICLSTTTGRSSCRGVDGRHWNSHCTNTHTFVRALTSFQNLVAWRYIRINVACVCVLSRKSWRH